MYVPASSIHRFLRRGSNICLMASGDGHWYKTTLVRRSESYRPNVNEWIGSQLLSQVGVATPVVRIVETSTEFLGEHSAQMSANGIDPATVEVLHCGSRYPGDPTSAVVYDYLPDAILARTENLDDFVGALLVDLWCGSASRWRNTIFTRSATDRQSFRVQMVNHSDLFGREAWKLNNTPAPGLCVSRLPYANLTRLSDLSRWIELILNIKSSWLESLVSSVPEQWLEADRLELEVLLHRLSRRRRELSQLVRRFIETHPQCFLSWRGQSKFVKAAQSQDAPQDAIKKSVA